MLPETTGSPLDLGVELVTGLAVSPTDILEVSNMIEGSWLWGPGGGEETLGTASGRYASTSIGSSRVGALGVGLTVGLV